MAHPTKNISTGFSDNYGKEIFDSDKIQFEMIINSKLEKVSGFVSNTSLDKDNPSWCINSCVGLIGIENFPIDRQIENSPFYKQCRKYDFKVISN
jgi:hypothetical protein